MNCQCWPGQLLKRQAFAGLVVNYDFAERDIVHIQRVLTHLEHSTESVLALEASIVVSLRYWRARVHAILFMPLLPLHIEKQAKDLLGRVRNLEASAGSVKATH